MFYTGLPYFIYIHAYGIICMVANFEQEKEKETYQQMKEREEREKPEIVKTMLLELTGKEYTDTCAKCGIKIIVTKGNDLINKMYNHPLNMRNKERHETKYSVFDWDTGYTVGLENIKVCKNCYWKNCDEEKKQEELQELNRKLKLTKPLRKHIKTVYQCPVCKEVFNSKTLTEIHLTEHENKEIKEKLNHLCGTHYRGYSLYNDKILRKGDF